MSSFSSFSSTPRKKYDLFLSFRGEDNRLTFTSHLYAALTQKGLFYTFKDDYELEKGSYIASELLKAIKKSRFSIVVLSQDYASSSWCLKELAKIVECMGASQHILPIFYHVDPSHVRKQSGSYGHAFNKHEQDSRLNSHEVQSWRVALTTVGNLAGWHVKDKITDEAEFIRGFVDHVRRKVGPGLIKTLEGLFGMDLRLKKLDNCVEKTTSRDVHFIGIYGTGGIGKTTLATAYYNWMCDKFEGSSCFLKNVREECERNGLVHLQKQLLSQIVGQESEITDAESGKEMIKSRLCSKKVLIVLDDVNKPKELQALADNAEWFGGGSIIIVTTRKEGLLRKTYQEITMYKAEQLNNSDALQLFSWKAFKSNEPSEDYRELSQEAIAYAENLPLALEVLGSHLFGKTENDWRRALQTLKEYPTNDMITSILQTSFDALEKPVKEIFLDVASFFNGCEKNYVIEFLDSCEFSPKNGIRILKEKSLLSIQHGNKLWMHDLVQEMGKKIVQTKSKNELERRSRIWNAKDFHTILENKTGTDKVKAIVTYFEGSRNLSFEAFSHMKNLRLLKIWGSYSSPKSDALTPSLKFLSNELQILHWNGFPCREFPSSFRPRGLVQLELIESKIEKLWNDHSTPLNHLKIIDLRCSRYFREFEDFEAVPYLERLNLEGCIKLSKIHPSITVLRKLILLNLKDCTGLEKFPKSIKGLNSLKTLDLYGCSKLHELPEDFGDLQNLIELDVRKSGLIHLPSSIFLIENLQTLFCSDEVAESTLRENIMNPTSGKCFLPRSFCSLKELDLSHCKLSEEAFPEYFGGLVSLENLNLSRNPFSVLPQSIKKLSNLTHLNLEHCQNLTHLGLELPSTLENVKVNYCTSLNSFDPKFKPCYLRCVDCFELVQEQGSRRTALTLLQRYFQDPTDHSRDFDIILPGSEIPAWFKTKSSVPSTISIKIDPNWYKNKNWIGFAMSVCLHANSSSSDNLKYVVKCGGNEVAKSSKTMYSIRRIENRSSDHLWLFYLHRNSMNLSWLYKADGNLEFSFYAYINGKVEDKSCFGPCGLRLVYKNDIEELNQISNNYFNESDPHQEADLHSSPSIRVESMTNPTVGKGVFSGHDPSSLTKLDLSNRKLTDEPFPDFGCLVSLQDLNLSKNSFHALPPSIKNLSKLKYLNLEYCTSLKCLGPELPSSLETIVVNYCTSLNSFLDPLKPCHLQSSAFCVDCSELVKKQDSTKTALTSLKRYLQESPDGSLRFDIVLPGSKIPEWFSHLDGGPSIRTKLFPNWCTSEWMGFAVFVLFPAKPSSYNLFCHIQAFGYDFEATPKHFTNVGSSDDDHLWLFYLSRDYFPKEWLQNRAGIVEFSFSYERCKFVCGVRLVYKKDTENLHQFITSQ